MRPPGGVERFELVKLSMHNIDFLLLLTLHRFYCDYI